MRDALDRIKQVTTQAELAAELRDLRRRHARSRRDSELTVRELAARSGYAIGPISEYFTGNALPPTDRFDVLVRLLDASPAEQAALATARDRVEEARRARRRTGGGRRAPRELPPDVAGFVGRERDLAVLDDLLDETGPVIAVVSGPAGVGKTAAVVRWAYRVGDRFPDGVLHVDLRGYDPEQPMRHREALATVLRGLGVPAATMPEDVEERVTALRAELADRRVLLVLDNAHDIDQVRPLLPGGTASFVVVTSRDAIGGLVVGYGARRLVLDVLPAEDAVGLLTRLVGDRARADPAATAELAERCSRLPLALRLAAELAALRPDVPLVGLVAELGSDPLDSLAVTGDRRTNVREVFSWSLGHQPAALVRAFRAAGGHVGRLVDPFTLAALADIDLRAARAALRDLSRAHLLHAVGDRFAMHDLLRAYAVELAGDEVAADRSRLVDHYASASSRAMDLLHPHEKSRRPVVPPCATPVPPMGSATDASAWLDAHRLDLVAATVHAARHGTVAQAAGISLTVARHLDLSGQFDAALAVHEAVLDAARRHGDRPVEAESLAQLGITHNRRGRYRIALPLLEAALAAQRDVDDPVGAAGTSTALGVAYAELGRRQDAVVVFEEALALHRSVGARRGEGYTLTNLGNLYQWMDRPADSLRFLLEARDVLRELGDPGEGMALSHLGNAHRSLGDLDAARSFLDEALTVHRGPNGMPRGEIDTLEVLGRLHLDAGRPAEAVAVLESALEALEDRDLDDLLAVVLNTLGRGLRATGSPEEARARHEEVLALAAENDLPEEEAGAHRGLGWHAFDTGDVVQAHAHWRLALERYERVGSEEDAKEVRALLA